MRGFAIGWVLALATGCVVEEGVDVDVVDQDPMTASAVAADPVAERGAAVFATHCASCHGPEGRGDGALAEALDPKPVDLHGPRPAHLMGMPGGRRAVIEQGSPGTAMVGFTETLSPEDLDAVYLHVHNMRHGAASTEAPPPQPARDPGCGRHADGGCDCGAMGGGH